MSQRTLISLAVSACLALVPAGIVFAQTDSTPPTLDLFSFLPTAIDVSSGSVAVIATFQASDDLSGVALAGVTFTSPGSPLEFKSCTAATPVSGTPLAGTFECNLDFPQGAQSGVWNVLQVDLQDVEGNGSSYSGITLDAAGYPTQLVVSQQPDVTPPTLLDFDFAPSSINTINGSSTVTAMFEVDDDFSGIAWIKVAFVSPGTTPIVRGCTSVVYNPGTIGMDAGGSFDCQVDFPQFSEEGMWTVTNVDVSDISGNIRSYSTAELSGLGFPTTLNVTSQSDLAAPVLLDFSFAPDLVDTTAAAALVPATVHATDDLAGIASVTVAFTSPAGIGQLLDCSSSAPVLGTGLDGVYTCDLPVPMFSSEGAWPASVEIRDNVDNLARLEAGDLATLMLSSELTIGYLDGPPRAEIITPSDGRSARGDSLTVRARLALGSPGEISPSLGVLFEYRSLPFGTFAPIPAVDVEHANPDIQPPYYIHWDTTAVTDGDYELRAVAHDPGGSPDPAPPIISITIDNGGSADIDESINPDGLQESRVAVDDLVDSDASSADRKSSGPAASWYAPAGAITATSDTLQLVFVDPAGEIARLEQPDQDLGAYAELSLISGQPVLDNGQAADLTLTYPDADQDGVVDGTSIREDEIELRLYDAASDAYLLVPGARVLVEHNLVHASVDALGRYALMGPLQPRIEFLPDGETLTWPVVSEALLYHVYRAALGSMIDGDDDGLPDAGYGDCRNFLDPDPSDTVFLDNELPPGPGEGFIYFIGFESAAGDRGLGNTSAGLRREPALVCP